MRPIHQLEVTEHAVLRYVQRVLGVDVDKVRASMVPPAVRFLAECGATRIPHEGLIWYADSGRITTLVVADEVRNVSSTARHLGKGKKVGGRTVEQHFRHVTGAAGNA